MGAVYQAFDHELGVVVAIKVIRPEVMADPFAAADLERRFKQELLLARQVTHKNVVRIHELGEFEGIKFLTMPFIEGVELATLIQREPQIALERVLKIARGIATGLEAAHAAGVVHRDLKPANVMVDKTGEALIMDFGIARSTGGANPAPTAGGASGSANWSAAGTMAGSVVGTVQYMAPEQARAEPVDHRADIYAFGLIVYDMLLHQPRSRHTRTALEELTSACSRRRRRRVRLTTAIPEPVDRLVTRCLQPDKAKRFQTTPDLVAALNRLDDRGHLLPVLRRVSRQFVAGVVGGVLILLGLTAWLARGPAVPVEHEPISVVIADFENRTNDPVFQGTLENALSIALEGASFITSYTREDARRNVAQIKPGALLDEAGARLLAVREGIKVVLTGSIEPAGSGYNLTVTAIDPAADKPLVTSSEGASSKAEVLQVVGTMASTIRSALGDETPESVRLSAAETVTAASLEALQSYSEGQKLQINSKYDEAIAYYRRAIEQDPKFGRAYSSWAVSAYSLGRRDEADGLYKQAFALMERMTEREKYRVYGTYYLTIARNYQQAIDNYSQLLKLYPADRAARTNLAFAYFSTLDFTRALEENRRAMDIYQGNFKLWSNQALYAMYAGDFKTAEAEALARARGEPELLSRVSAARDRRARPLRRRWRRARPTRKWPRSTDRARRWRRWAWPTC